MEQKMINGYDLVRKGFTKIETTLPEVGLKHVQPNGTWLEGKQIQSALEARKHLIEVERIEKSGSLSIAVWIEDLMLAKVTQQVGGHWQYMGHSVSNQLFLYPEEALFLMEVNCLQLIHNEVKVSLQQAYSLLLRDNITLLQYKVYASLSRLGYRVYRHKKSSVTEYEKKINLSGSSKSDNQFSSSSSYMPEDSNFIEVDNETISSSSGDVENASTPELNLEDSMTGITTNVRSKSCSTQKRHRSLMYNRLKLRKLRNRVVRPCYNDKIHQYFDELPDFFTKGRITIRVPDACYLPNHIKLNKSSYNINLDAVSNMTQSQVSSETNIYGMDDEVNGSHIRRLSTASANNYSSNNRPNPNWNRQSQYMRYQYRNPHFQRDFNAYRPRPFFCNFNVLLQRSFMPRWYQPFRFYPTNQFFLNQNVNFYDNNIIYTNFTNERHKRKRNQKKRHLDGIRRLAQRLKQFVRFRNTHSTLIHSLHQLINTYNARYKTKVTLTNDFDVLVNETIVDTIDLDEEDETSSKRRKTDTQDQTFEDNLQKLKHLALELRNLENNGKATPRHRRTFSKALKALNENYNVEYCVNEMHEIINNRHIDLDSSSDSDCVLEEEITEMPKATSKQLKNPFNILKRLSEKSSDPTEGHSSSDRIEYIIKDNKYDKFFDTFPKHWLPPENDFGRAEVVTEDFSDCRQEEFIYDFLKMQPNKYNNWLELKQSFFNSLKETMEEFLGASKTMNKDVKSLVKPEDCTDMNTVLNKLRIIKTECKISEKCHLSIDFDVYNRNVQNFRKSYRPKPHFRLICLQESSKIPSGEEIATLHAAYNDNVAIFFAVVNEASISYIQMKPTDLPVYIANMSS